MITASGWHAPRACRFRVIERLSVAWDVEYGVSWLRAASSFGRTARVRNVNEYYALTKREPTKRAPVRVDRTEVFSNTFESL